MSDPLRTDPLHGPDGPGDASREARIEQLLLSGLDHYFTGDYEKAINIWTRVVFLERKHDRARAYIERARSALAERQRESEELVHRGVAAYDAGDIASARELLTEAVEQGGPSDTALLFLGRLNRLGGGTTVVEPPPQPGADDAEPIAAPIVRGSRQRWVHAGLAALAAFALLVGALPVVDWLRESQAPAARPAAVVRPEPLPIVRSAELALERARAFYEGGHLHDALAALERIDIADPLRPAADRLKADVQRRLLTAAGSDMPAPAAPGSDQ